MTSANSVATRLATRLAFLVAGLGAAAWAPIVPIVKQNLGLDDSALGLILLCRGIGSVAAMLATGPLAARYGSKPVIVSSGIGLVISMPLLAGAPTPLLLGVAMVLCGAALGSLDVSMNVHAVEVERASARPLMSGFHGLYSIGGFAGSLILTTLMSARISAFEGMVMTAVPMLAAMLVATPRRLVACNVANGPMLAFPKGVVLLLSGLAAATFLVEGAMLNWSALLITGTHLVPQDQGGIGYILFAVAMAAGRLGGDVVTARLGDRATLVAGGTLAVAGFAILLAAPWAYVALSGFLLIGLGAANIVPVFFRLAGSQTAMPYALAIGSFTTAGYAGVLVGPAAIGFASNAIGLSASFWILASLMALVPLTAHIVTRLGP